MITPPIKAGPQEKEAEARIGGTETAGDHPPVPVDKNPVFAGAAAKKARVRTLPESKSSVSTSLEKDRMSTPTPDTDESKES